MMNRKDSRNASSRFVRALLRDRKGTAGAVLLLFFVVLACFPGQIAPYSPTYIGFPRALGPSGAHWLGTTSQGQDIFSQLIWGTRETLIIAVAAGGLATLIAVLVGVSAAYLGGITDGVLSLFTDVLLVIPILPLIIVIAAYLRSAGLTDIIIVLGALGWSYGARQLRVQALSLRNRDFLTAASVRGERRRYIIVAEILPTLTSLIVATFLGSAVFAVLTAAGLQFIGLGDPSAQSWGTMLYWAQNNEALGAGLPLWAIMPGACIALLGGAFAFLNYAFDEISNPALRPVRRLSRKPAVRSDGQPAAPAERPKVNAPLDGARETRPGGGEGCPRRRCTRAAVRAAARGPRAVGGLRFRRRPGRGRRPRRSRSRPGRVPRRGGRVRVREIDPHARHLAVAGQAGGHHRRQRGLPRPRAGTAERQAAPACPLAGVLRRHAERDELTEPGDDHRPADAGRLQSAFGHVEGGRPPPIRCKEDMPSCSARSVTFPRGKTLSSKSNSSTAPTATMISMPGSLRRHRISTLAANATTSKVTSPLPSRWPATNRPTSSSLAGTSRFRAVTATKSPQSSNQNQP